MSTKKDLIEKVAEEAGLNKTNAKAFVQKTFDAMANSLIEQKHLEIRNFGVFEIRTRKGRQGRNPKTGAPVLVKDKTVVRFRPGKALKALLLTVPAGGPQAASSEPTA